MANPNINNVTSILGNLGQTNLSTTAATSLISNAASSGTLVKVETVQVTNTTATAANFTLNTYSAAALGGTAFAFASTISILPYTTVTIIDKTNSIYLTENTSMGATAGTANALIVTAAWEVMS